MVANDNKKTDKLVLSAIEAIESINEEGLKPRVISISSFLKGASSSPYYECYKKFPKICGAIKLSPQEVKESCLRLIDGAKIVENKSNGRSYYTICTKDTTFLSTCSKSEIKLIKAIQAYINKKIANLKICDKVNRYTFMDTEIKAADGIEYSWMWIVRSNGYLTFRYKFNQNDTDRTLYEKNNVIINEFQMQTIFHIIDFIIINA